MNVLHSLSMCGGDSADAIIVADEEGWNLADNLAADNTDLHVETTGDGCMI